MAKIRFGIAGCGRIAKTHAREIIDLPQAELAAVCDINMQNLESFTSRYGVRGYLDYKEMLNRKEVDVIIICTPSGLHAEMGVMAAHSGKHVLIEKPMALNLEEAILNISRAYNLVVIEDACQAMGAEYKGKKAGAIGHSGCFSFFPTKNLGCFGDGGMVVTDDEETAGRIKVLRAHGASNKFIHDIVGCNSRLDEIQAAILLVKLIHFEEWLNKRAALAELYTLLLKDVVITPYVTTGNKHTYHLYVIRSPQRELIKKHLGKNGVSCGVYYPQPLHLQPAFRNLGYGKGEFPEAEKASEELLAIPLYPEMTTSEVEMIAHLIRQGITRT